MPNRMTRAFASAYLWLKRHGELVGLAGLVSGAALGVGIPIWQTYWVDTPKLSVEIYSIDRQISPDARIPADDDSISVLARTSSILSLEDRFSLSGDSSALLTTQARAIGRSGYTAKEVTDLVSRARQELKSLPEKVDERQRQLREIETITAERLTTSDISRFNSPIGNEFRGNLSLIGQPTAEGIAERQKAVEHFRKEYSKRYDTLQKRYTELQTQLPTAERRIDELKRDLEDKKGFFQITAVLNNAGRKSVSIRQLALLRVYIGKGNYVDLKLSLKDYQTNAEIGANGTRIVTFVSDLLEAFPDADRTLISTYWGQSVAGILFSEDISGAMHSSNRISFAKGLYQKVIFDRLSAEASREIYLSPRD